MFLQITLLVISPLVFLWLEPKVKIIKILGPVIMCYLFGFLIGNNPFFKFNGDLTHKVVEAVVPLSIPMLLFSTDLMKWLRLARSTVISFVLLIISVLVAVTLTALMFKNIIPDVSKVAGMLVGVYTGGTPNMSAIGYALGVKEEVFLLLNTSDMILGGSYFFLSLSLIPKMLAKFLPPFKFNDPKNHEHHEFHIEDLKPKNWLQYVFIFFLSATILGVSIGISQLFLKTMSAGLIILLITTFALGLSFAPKIRSIPCSYDLGNYLLLIFCVGIGSMADLSKFNLNSLNYFYMVLLVIVLSSSLHFFLSYLFKIDRDTALITSTAGIFGPAFIGPVASAVNNREILVSGITCGLVGIALGNYLGLMLAGILSGL